MRLGPPPDRARGPRPVLDRLHPRHGAGLPQADDRAARASSSPRPSRRSSTARSTSTRGSREIIDELEPDVIVEDNVVGFPAMHGDRPAVGPDRCRATRRRSRTRCVAPFSSGYPAADRSAWPAFLEEVERTHANVGRLRRLLPRARRAGARLARARARLHARVAVAQPVLYPAEADYERARPARADVAPAGLVGPRGGRRRGRCPAQLRERGRAADLPVPRQPRLGRRRADAAARRPPGADAPPGDRVARGRSRTRSRSTTT